MFIKVDQLEPDTSGHTLTIKVINWNSISQKSCASSHLCPARISECLIGDETVSIFFTTHINQICALNQFVKISNVEYKKIHDDEEGNDNHISKQMQTIDIYKLMLASSLGCYINSIRRQTPTRLYVMLSSSKSLCNMF
ncbi:hypothetical protein Bca4012_056440 [Brassica carinata]